MRGPLDVLRETWQSSMKSEESVVSHVLSIRDKLEKMKYIADSNLEQAQLRHLGKRGGNQMVKIVLMEAKTDKTIGDNAVAQIISEQCESLRTATNWNHHFAANG